MLTLSLLLAPQSLCANLRKTSPLSALEQKTSDLEGSRERIEFAISGEKAKIDNLKAKPKPNILRDGLTFITSVVNPKKKSNPELGIR